MTSELARPSGGRVPGSPAGVGGQRAHADILVGGRWTSTDRELVSCAAGTGEELGRTWLAGEQELEDATQAALAAFATTRRQASHERSAVLRRAADGIRESADELAVLLAQEAGKPLTDARTEVERTAVAFRIAAEEAERITGEVLPLDIIPTSRGTWGLTRRMPIGPVAAITPFNVPLNLSAHKVAPALAVGNPVVLKPDSRVALTLLSLARVLVEAGVPDGALSVLPMDVAVADRLVTDERFRLLSFTGSAAVGWDMRARAGTKAVVLELGGNAAAIVDADADIEDAVSRILKGAFKHAGQLCISVQQLFVHRSIYRAVTDAIVAGAREIRVGPPLEDGVEVGPMITDEAAERALALIEEAVERGAELLVGGERDGAYLRPTVLAGVAPTSPLCREEAFAPLLVVTPFDELDEAIARINDGPYGLQAGLFTNDMNHIWHAFEELQVGGLIVNNVPTYRVDHMPYGGVKRSGLGREGIRYAIEHMTELRLLVMAPAVDQR